MIARKSGAEPSGRLTFNDGSIKWPRTVRPDLTRTTHVGQLLEWLVAWISSHIFRFRPRIRTEDGKLIASSGWRARILSLGLWIRRVEVDRQRQIIRIRTRIAWFFTSSRVIPFDRIEEVLYSYGDYGAASSWEVHQQTDLYTVGLLLEGGEEVKLFRFYGQGDFFTDGAFPDWFYWEEMVQARLTAKPNDDESLHYADLLAAIIEVPIGNPRM